MLLALKEVQASNLTSAEVAASALSVEGCSVVR